MSKLTPTRVLLLCTLAAMAKRVFVASTKFARVSTQLGYRASVVAVLILVTLTSVYSITRAGVPTAQAAAPATLNFQARLMSSAGNLVPDGDYNIEFKLYNASTSSGSSQGSCTGDANCLWTETRTASKVQVKNGYMSAYLGDTSALPTNIWDQQLWLTMNIGGTGLAAWDGEMTPRIRLTSVPYAFRATVAESAETLSKNTGSFTGTVDFNTLTADRRYLFPDTSLATTASPGTICVYNGAASNCPAASGSAYYIQNDTVLQTQSNYNIQGRDSGVNGTVVGVLRGAAAGQTVDLLQFQASGGSVLGAVTAAGNLQVASSIDTRSVGTLSVGTTTASAVSIGKSGAATTVNGTLTVAEAFTANGGATVTGVTNINTTGTSVTTIGNSGAGITLDGAVTVNELATFNDSVVVATGQSITLVGGATGTRPASPAEGMLYYDTTTKQLLVYANGKWQADRATETKIIAPSNASDAAKASADVVLTGTADQTLVNSTLVSAAGGKVYLLEGTYTLTGSIAIPNNTTLVGSGPRTVIQLDIGSGSGSAITNLDTTTGAGITIRDLTVDGSLGTGGTQRGIYFDGLTDTVASSDLNNLTLSGWGSGAALYLDNTSNLNSVNRNLITGAVTLDDNSAISSLTDNTLSGPVSVSDSSGILTFSNNIVTANVSFDNSTGYTFSGNSIFGSLSVVNGASLVNINANSIIGGAIVDTATVNNIVGNILGGLTLDTITGATVNGNSIARTGVDGIVLIAADNVRLTSNRIYDSGGSGVAINLNNTSDDTYLADNDLGGLGITDNGTGTIYGGQANGSNNFVIQPASGSSIELMANTNISGNLTVTGDGTFTGGDLTVATTTATDDRLIVSVAAGGAARFDGTLTSDDLTQARTWTLPDEDGEICLDSGNCGFIAGTADDFIQNQNASQQVTSNFWISGTARSDTSVLTPTLDTATAVSLGIGTTTASAVSIARSGILTTVEGTLTVDEAATFNGSIVVAAGQSITITGSGTRPASPVEGMLYYDTTTKQLLIYANGKWQADRSDAVIVAANNSSQADKDSADYVANGNTGAAADGDQVQINQALTAAAGKKVVLLAGTYVADATILVPNDTTLTGVGRQTLVELADLDATDTLIENSDTTTGSGVTVTNLRLDGRNDLNSTGVQYGISFTGMGSSSRASGKITNVEASRFRSSAILVDTSYGVTVSGNTTNSNSDGAGTGGLGIYVNNSQNMLVNGNIANSNFQGFLDSQGTRNNYSNNSANSNTSTGYVFLSSSYLIVSNNTASSNSIYGLYLSATTNSTFESNSVSGGVDNIYVAGGSANTITNNTFTGASFVGIDMAGTTNNIVKGNRVSSSAASAIYLHGASHNNIVSSNNVEDSGSAANNYGIIVDDSDNNSITGNLITDSSATTTNYAISIAVNTSNTNYVADNNLGGGGVQDLGTGTIFGGQLNGSNNYVIQPAGTIELVGSTNVTGVLTASTSVLTPTVDTATGVTLNIGTTTATAVSISRTGVATTVNGSLAVTQGTTLSGGLAVTSGGNVAFQRNATAYSATGTQADVNFGTGALFRITSASALTINSIAGGADGRIITLMNASANAVTLANETGATTSNRIITGTGTSITIPAGASITLAYDSADSRWRVIGSTASANGYIQLQSGTPGTAQTGNFNISGTGIVGTAIQAPLLDTASAQALNIGTTNATQINLNENTQITGNLSFATGSNRTLTVVQSTGSNTGYNLTIAAGQGASTGAGFAGGDLVLQGGAAGVGSGDIAGGNILIEGGAAHSDGVGGSVIIRGGDSNGIARGLVSLYPTVFTSTGSTVSFGTSTTLGVSNLDSFSTIPASATATGLTLTIPAPTYASVGRILYISNVGSNDFNILLSGTAINISLKPNTTATLIWNGNGWTAAGASSSTDLQSAYNNTLTSAGGAEIVLNPTGGAADGFTIRNNGTTPITGGLLEVQSSVGTNLFSVNNFGTEFAANGGSETLATFTTNWTAAPAGGTVSRTTTAGQYVTGLAGAQVVTTSTANTGIRNNLSGNPVNTIGAKYQVSFTAKSTLSGTPIEVHYSRNGGTNLTACTDYGAAGAQNLSNTVWTKITCTITIDSATAATDPDLFIRKTGATAPTIYIDNLSFIRNDTTTQPSNVQIGGGVNGGPVTLFTLDRSSAPPVAAGDSTYYGSMYYDTTTGRIQCYEIDGWGACGAPPDNIISLTPEYAGAVLGAPGNVLGGGNVTAGIGVLTADFCANQTGILVTPATGNICASAEARNFYRWTSPQATQQVYSIYVNYKLPSTFKTFADANTIKLTALTDSLTNGIATLQVFRKTGSGVTSCGAATTINSSINTWQTTSFGGDETACSFVGGDNIVFKIDVKSLNNGNIYIENLDFVFNNT